MRALTAPIRFVGRVLLWIFLFPVGIWRSIVNRRVKEQRRREKFEAKQRDLDRKAMRERPLA